MVSPIVIGKKKRKVTDEHRARPQPQRIRVPVAALMRMFVIGSISVVAAVYALWRHYTVPHMPMLVPVPPASSAPAADPTNQPDSEREIEIETTP
jgi:hypothetical protein